MISSTVARLKPAPKRSSWRELGVKSVATPLGQRARQHYDAESLVDVRDSASVQEQDLASRGGFKAAEPKRFS